jgi:2-polyprenyl-3-methyl-5-hydroxy-6-metoxy-1,4-benzoquinol methylase
MDKARGGTMLDLGGSTGVVADWLARAFNLDATVVEPSAGEALRAHDKGLAVANVPLEEYDAGGNHYDLVLLCQTVDHLLDIRWALARIRDLVAPGGLFFVDFVEDGPIKIDHPFYLTRKTMTEYLRRAGFEVRAQEKSEDGLHVNVLAAVA